jgi:hypothetical protein
LQGFEEFPVEVVHGDNCKACVRFSATENWRGGEARERESLPPMSPMNTDGVDARGGSSVEIGVIGGE